MPPFVIHSVSSSMLCIGILLPCASMQSGFWVNCVSPPLLKIPFLSLSSCTATGSMVHGISERFVTVPVNSIEEPVSISGTISHRTGLSGSVGSTCPQGGRSALPPFTSLINQCVELTSTKSTISSASPVNMGLLFVMFIVPSHNML